jgi:integrase
MMKNGESKNGVRKRYRKDGTLYWEARLTLPGGKRTQFYGDTKGEAERKREEAKRRVANNEPLLNDRLTTEAYLTRWLAGRRNLKPRTLARYEELIRLHLIPTLGYVPLARLAPDQIDQMYTAKERAGLSRTTVHHLHAVLHKALEDALRQGLVYYNVTERIADPPRMPKHKTNTFTYDQALQLLKTAKEEPRWQRWYTLFVLALTTGLREGELLALRWDDAHLDDPEPFLEVDENLYFLHGAQFGTPKSEQSERKVLLIPMAVEALRSHQTRQKEERLRAPRWDTSFNLIFPSTVGTPMAANNFLKRVYHPLLIAAVLPDRNFHQLRHAAATFLLKEGVPPLIVAAILGHAQAAFTMDRYGHADLEMQQQAVEVMKRLYGNG